MRSYCDNGSKLKYSGFVSIVYTQFFSIPVHSKDANLRGGHRKNTHTHTQYMCIVDVLMFRYWNTAAFSHRSLLLVLCVHVHISANIFVLFIGSYINSIGSEFVLSLPSFGPFVHLMHLFASRRPTKWRTYHFSKDNMIICQCVPLYAKQLHRHRIIFY